MLAHVTDAVVGIDTHRDTHQAELATPTGVVIATAQFPNSSRGFTELLAWLTEHAPGPRVTAAVEGTRSYGIGVTRALLAAGYPVIEAGQPGRATRRGKGKSDSIDAHHAVLFALGQNNDALPTPRADGAREALRILLCARSELTLTSTGQTNRLRALLLSGDDTDRAHARAKEMTKGRLTTLASYPDGPDPHSRTRASEIRRLATALLTARTELAHNTTALREILHTIAPDLLDLPGVGPVSAAQIIISYSHHGRVRDHNAFASLAGTAPIPASSGQTTRWRLNRGGDRQLNRAIHTIATTRMRMDPETKAYLTKRTANGQSRSETRRILKRYITRELFNTLRQLPLAT